MNNERFQVEEQIDDCHCCMAYFVVDTTKPDDVAVCEAFSMENAQMVRDALNAWGRDENK
jgi:uncharacterized alpha-E superfamily protein